MLIETLRIFCTDILYKGENVETLTLFYKILTANLKIGEKRFDITYPTFIVCQEDHLRVASPAQSRFFSYTVLLDMHGIPTTFPLC
jgi:hypothetical protein